MAVGSDSATSAAAGPAGTVGERLSSRRPPALYAILAVGLTSFAFSPILIRYATDVPAASVAAWRAVLAVVLLAPFAASRTGEIRRLETREMRLITVAGVMLALHFLTWIESLYHTTVASASVLVSSSPIFLAILGLFVLRERLSTRTVIAIGCAVVGAVMIGTGDARHAVASNPLLGNALATLAAFFVSLYLLVGRVVRQDISWITYVFIMYSVSAVTVLLYVLMIGAPLFGFETRFYVIFGLMALGPQIAGHGSFNYAVKFLPAAVLGLLSLTEPVGGSILAYFLFDEVPSLLAVVGMMVVLVAVGSALTWKRPDRDKPASG